MTGEKQIDRAYLNELLKVLIMDRDNFTIRSTDRELQNQEDGGVYCRHGDPEALPNFHNFGWEESETASKDWAAAMGTDVNMRHAYGLVRDLEAPEY